LTIELEPAPNAAEKIKVLVLSDHPLSPSGVGTQTNYMVTSLLDTGKFSFICLGGAVKHHNYNPVRTEQYGDDLVIYPVDGYGTQEMIRSLMRTERPDIMWIMTDPRFWGWLWDIEDEIRTNIPIVYYHVWDNYPYPKFNESYYKSNDHIACISKLTYDIVQNVAPDVPSTYIPHAVEPGIFGKQSEDKIMQFKKQYFPQVCNWDKEEKFIFFWNNRNARRKMSGSVLYWFKEFLDEVGHDKASLVMHTDPKDPHGQDLEAIAHQLDMLDGQVVFSTAKQPSTILAMLYNVADCTINISDAEGFGLATLESLACGTPIIVNMTGGLQEQATNGEEWFGIGLQPASKAIIGSQPVPYIYEDRVSKEDYINALKKMLNMSKEDRDEIGRKGMKHIEDNYNFETFQKQWIDLMLSVHEKYGSWKDRKNYKSWDLMEIE
jgi:glycosyltransferase involved in cell wall biosynthesis